MYCHYGLASRVLCLSHQSHKSYVPVDPLGVQLTFSPVTGFSVKTSVGRDTAIQRDYGNRRQSLPLPDLQQDFYNPWGRRKNIPPLLRPLRVMIPQA